MPSEKKTPCIFHIFSFSANIIITNQIFFDRREDQERFGELIIQEKRPKLYFLQQALWSGSPPFLANQNFWQIACLDRNVILLMPQSNNKSSPTQHFFKNCPKLTQCYSIDASLTILNFSSVNKQAWPTVCSLFSMRF